MKDKVLMVIFVLILGIVLTTALVGVDYYTAPMIEKNRVLKTNTRVLSAFDIPYTEDKMEEIFSAVVSERDIKEKKFYIQDGNVAFEINGSGLWGPISGILALDSDLETIKGLTIIHQEETPGLGGRISEKDFLSKFRGKKLAPEIVITTPGKAKADNEVDGITGATLTCNAFQRVINDQAKEYISLYRK